MDGATTTLVPLSVFDEGPLETDDLIMILVCSGGKKVAADAHLLCLMSPEVLNHIVKEAVYSWKTAGGGPNQLQLSVAEDEAEDWLRALKLAHPALTPSQWPVMTLVGASSSPCRNADPC